MLSLIDGRVLCETGFARGLQEVQDAVEEAKLGKEPPIEDLWNNVYKDGLGATMRPIQMGRPRIPV